MYTFFILLDWIQQYIEYLLQSVDSMYNNKFGYNK